MIKKNCPSYKNVTTGLFAFGCLFFFTHAQARLFYNIDTLVSNLSGPVGVALDGAGNTYIAESDSNRIDKVDSKGVMTTFKAGTLSNPHDVAVDKVGNVYIADTNNKRIQKVDTHGVVTTFAGNSAAKNLGDGVTDYAGFAGMSRRRCGSKYGFVHRGYVRQPHSEGGWHDRHHHNRGRQRQKRIFRRQWPGDVGKPFNPVIDCVRSFRDSLYQRRRK